MKIPAISVEQVTQCWLTYRITASEEYRDHNGHMNVRWYMAVFDDAGYPMADEVGLTLDYHKTHGTGGFDHEHHIHYLREVHVGDTVAVYVRFVARSAKRIHYLMFMVNETRGTLASVFECVNSFADLSVRRTAPFPPEIAARMDEKLAQHTALSWDAPVCGVMSA
jgi:acyl-CoA thioester hydrolase